MPEIIYRRTGLSYFYFSMAVVFAVLGLLLLLAGVGRSFDPEPWSEKWIGAVGFIAAGLSWLFGVLQMWELGKGYRNNEVRLSAGRFFLRTPAGTQIEFALSEVRNVTWNGRACTVETEKLQYRFDHRTCPRSSRIARILAERSPVPLDASKVSNVE